MSQARVRGLTLVELLVTMAIVGIVLVIVGAFFTSQARVSTDIQDRNELNIRLRTAAEGVAQDLQMAGAQAVVDSSGPRYVTDVPLTAQNLTCGPLYVTCDDPDGNPLIDDLVLSVLYASSLRGDIDGTGGVCRNVVYRFDADAQVLYRSDIDCGDFDFDPALPELPNFATEFASGISSFDVAFFCEDGAEDTTTGACGEQGVRRSTITLEGVSLRQPERHAELALTVTMPNTRKRSQ